MKKTRLNQLGKIGKRNLKASKEIDKLIMEYDIRSCEIRIPHKCLINSFLQKAHRHKRDWYKVVGREHLLYDYKQWIIACDVCHNLIEYDKELTKKVFMYLRGSEDLV